MASPQLTPEMGDGALKIPPPTVREATTFGGFTEATLVGGAQGLDRQIEWVRVMETPETPSRLRQGDLLLTTGFPVKDDPAAQIELVDTVSRSGGSGVVVKLGRYIDEVPGEMIEEAERLALPLFTIGQEVPWTDLMEPLLERIINAEHWRLKRSLDIHRRFTDLVLDGKGVNEICRTLAELLDSGVSVEDASFHLLAHASGTTSDPHRRETIARHGTPPRVLYDPQIQRVLRDVAESRRPMKVPAFPHLGMNRERIIAPILAANQLLGVISILDHPPDNEELAFMAVEQAALVMALALIKEREVAEVEGRVRGEYLDDLVQGTFGDEAAAQRRARHLGYPLPGRHVLLVVDIDDFRGFIRARQITEDAIQALKREFLRRVSGVIRGAYTRALLGSRSDSVMALLPLGLDTQDHLPRVQALGQQVRDAIADWRPGFTISVGYSAPVDAPDGVPTAHREVRAVLDTLARFKRWSQVVAVPELGLTGLLAGVSDDRLVEFVNRHLGPLVEHDRARGGNLIPTLKAYLEAGEQQAAARRLRVHPNTLRYRLDRVREISGAELDDAETRLNLAVALRVQGLLGL
ncbi:MAG TPA: PucR family transcriptional regulator ligand-binding domain-containing protein [Candidatus Dormibacteraeota bacterium]|nr:PucR family transcriptional regulator ligand-binding domain-containing protein [Candidatus Dormibacteraeota bacterium]